MISSILRSRSTVLIALALSTIATTSAHAGTISIVVPSLSTASSFEFGTNGNLTGWTNGTDGSGDNAYNFNFGSISQAKGAGAADEYGAGDHVILDPDTVADPNCIGCAFLGLDSDYHTGWISATISGLTIGATEVLTFDFAGTEQTGYTGASTDFLGVTFGGVSKSTSSVSVASQGFSGWSTASFTFTASAAQETLTFLAGGTQQFTGNEPAFALVDNIAITQTTPSPTPEPSSLMLLSTGLMGLGGFVRSRIKKGTEENV
jgi:hypothetical protein